MTMGNRAMQDESLKIGVVSVREMSYPPNSRFIEEAEKKGYDLFLINPYDVIPVIGEGRLTMKGAGWKHLPDLVIPRQGAQVGSSSITVLHQLAGMGIPLINTLASILVARHQFRTLQLLCRAGIDVPETRFVNDPASLTSAVEQLGGYPVVVKAVSGRQGRGVFLVTSERNLAGEILPILEPAKGLLVQEFVVPQGRRDIRVLVLGKKILGAMELKVKPGEFRSNYHLNHQALRVSLTEFMRSAALSSALAMGLDIAGVDLMVTQSGRILVSEVNYSPGFQGLEAVTGSNVAGSIIDHAVSVMKKMGSTQSTPVG